MMPRLAAWLIAILTVWPLCGAQAQVRSLTLGIDTSCPYGLAG